MAIFAPDDPPVVAVEDTEMFEVSPTPEAREVWTHLEEASRALQQGT
jgi:hypothetical protein